MSKKILASVVIGALGLGGATRIAAADDAALAFNPFDPAGSSIGALVVAIADSAVTTNLVAVSNVQIDKDKDKDKSPKKPHPQHPLGGNVPPTVKPPNPVHPLGK